MPRQAPASIGTLAGRPTACSDGSTIQSAAGPEATPPLFRRQYDPVGGGADRTPPLTVPDPDALADARGGNAVADGVDLAGAIAVRDDAREGDLARQAGTALDVGGIDA